MTRDGFLRTIQIALVAGAALAAACADSESPTAAAPPRPSFSLQRGGAGGSRHVIVMKHQSIPADLAAAIQAKGGRILRTDPEIGVVAVTGLSDAAVTALSARVDVLGIDRDVVARWLPPRPQLTTRVFQPAGAVHPATDQRGAFFFPNQWNLRQIKADSSWLTTNQGKGSLVCILDTGIDPGHLDLSGKVDLAISRSFVASEPFIEDLFFHGTAVASLVSSNGIGMASVAPDARLCAVKVLDQTGSGSFDDINAGIMYAARIHADVINMSLGAYFSRKLPGALQLIRAQQRAIAFAISRGALVVAAAGNEGVNLDRDPRDSIEVPGQLAGVLSVGATGPIDQQDFDRLASYTNFGLTGVDVMAPGGDFVTGNLDDLILAACSEFVCGDIFHYVLADGTSFSAPQASGAGAVAESEKRRNQIGFQLQLCIELGADDLGRPGIDPSYGFGRLNVLKAAKKCGHGLFF